MKQPKFSRYTGWGNYCLPFKFQLLLLALFIPFVQSKALANQGTEHLTIKLKNTSVVAIFKAIEQQSSFRVFYLDKNLEGAQPVSINVQDATIEQVMDFIAKDQPFSYKIDASSVLISRKATPFPITNPSRSSPGTDSTTVSGRVTSDKGEPLPGATVKVKGTNNGVTTDSNGGFTIHASKESVLIISYVGYQEKEVHDILSADFLRVRLSEAVNSLDETLVIGYGTTSKRYSTGSVSKVTGRDIENQAVSNPLAALEGRVPGMIVTQSNGVAGSSFKVQIRGQNSILQGSDPLYIIDGVPFSTGNEFLGQISSAAGDPNDPSKTRSAGISPFNLINPEDISSIEVLKDADATAIYGSRGANGVVLITTKKGQNGATKININVSKGKSSVVNNFDFLNTKQYVQMRLEGLANDGLVPSSNPADPGYAPDITLWDTTRYTNLRKILTGNSADYIDAQASISGGSDGTQFLIGTGYHRQTTVFPGDNSNNLASLHGNISHSSLNKKFQINFGTNLSYSQTNIVGGDLSGFLNSPPNLPSLYDSSGHLNFSKNGFSFVNPLAYLKQPYSSKSENSLNNLNLSYKIFPGLLFKANLGYSSIKVEELSKIPISSLDPELNLLGSAIFANSYSRSWIAEPQLQYNTKLWKGALEVLLGGTWNATDQSNSYIQGQNYSSDALLGSVNAAGNIQAVNNTVQYRYGAFFGRLNYNYLDKYLLNFSGRRDGSSRFGPGRQFANFGAIGGAWIFSNEPIIKKASNWLSFGKLRGSYGTTGNDQIGDYQYLDSWKPTVYSYLGENGIYPVRLNNPNYSWEVNKKTEIAIELGFMQDKLLFTASAFRNKSNNQLINYSLPIQTGFSSVIKNFNATVQNEGLEITLNSKNFRRKNFEWTTDFNLSFHRNRLVSFPGLASSAYSSVYIIGKSLSTVQGYKYKGVNPETGVYQFKDQDKDGAVTFPNDYVILGNLDPKYFGGLLNTFRFKNFVLDIFIEYRKQLGINYLARQNSFIPGRAFNQPSHVLDRWRKAGDNTNIQKFTSTTSSEAYSVIGNYLITSSGIYSDASYIRGKNMSLSYNIPPRIIAKAKIQQAKIFIRTQNIFTISRYKIGDPETQNIYSVPPLRTITAGLTLNL